MYVLKSSYSNVPTTAKIAILLPVVKSDIRTVAIWSEDDDDDSPLVGLGVGVAVGDTVGGGVRVEQSGAGSDAV